MGEDTHLVEKWVNTSVSESNPATSIKINSIDSLWIKNHTLRLQALEIKAKDI